MNENYDTKMERDGDGMEEAMHSCTDGAQTAPMKVNELL
jgi:hypothetical protein